jgi:hypothetical protein
MKSWSNYFAGGVFLGGQTRGLPPRGRTSSHDATGGVRANPPNRSPVRCTIVGSYLPSPSGPDTEGHGAVRLRRTHAVPADGIAGNIIGQLQFIRNRTDRHRRNPCPHLAGQLRPTAAPGLSWHNAGDHRRHLTHPANHASDRGTGRSAVAGSGDGASGTQYSTGRLPDGMGRQPGS